jgi:hypothetical protein
VGKEMKSKISLLLILICAITIPCVSAEIMINYTMFSPTASSDQGASYTAIKPLDNNIATTWQSGTHAPGVWWQADFGTLLYIDSYNITPTTGFASLYSPRDWWLSGSTDGSTWYVVDNRTSVTTWADTVNKTFNLQSNKSSYRYFKFQFIAGKYPSMGTMNLYNGGGGGGATDTTPPDSVTALTNSTANCTDIKWEWTNPGGSLNADYSRLYSLKNDVWVANYSNTTNEATWTGLTNNTLYKISTKTVDLKGNTNATWVNASSTTAVCSAGTPTPTPTPTPTTTTAIPTWQPEINPPTDYKADPLIIVKDWWWIVALVASLMIIFGGRR